MPDVKWAIVEQAAATGGGTQDFAGAGFTPKAAIFLISKGVTPGTSVDGAHFGFGATDGTRQAVISCSNLNGISPTNTDSYASNAHVCVLHEDTALRARASFTTWISGGVRITWNTTPAAAYRVTCLLLGGADFQAYVNSYSPGAFPLTVPCGFAADQVMVIGDDEEFSAQNIGSHAWPYLGLADSNGPAQRVLHHLSRNNTTSSTQQVRYDTTHVALRTFGTGTPDGSYTVAFNASDVVLTRDVGTHNLDAFVLCLKWGGLAHKLHARTTRSTPGTNTVTGVGFKPGLVFSVQTNSAPNVYTTNGDLTAGIGVATASAQSSVSFGDTDPANPTVNKSVAYNNRMIGCVRGAGAHSVIERLVFNSDGWTEESHTQVAALNAFALVVEEVSTGITGTGAITDGGETIQGAGTSKVTGAGAVSDGGEVLALAGTVRITGTGALADSGETIAGAGVAVVAGTGALADSGEAIAGAGTSVVTGVGDVADGGETFTGAGTSEVAGSGAATDSGEAISAIGTSSVVGSGTLTDAGEVIAGQSEQVVTGTGDVADGAEVIAGAGTVVVAGAGDLADAGEVLAGAGAVAVAGTGAIADNGETIAGAGAVVVVGTGALADAGEIIAGQSEQALTGTGALADSGEAIEGAGVVAVAGTGDVIDSGEVPAGVGAPVVTGTGDVADSGEVLAGSSEQVITGAGGVADSGETITGAGTSAITGVGALADVGEIVASSGFVVVTGTGSLDDVGEIITGAQIITTPAVVALSLAATHKITLSLDAARKIGLDIEAARLVGLSIEQ